LKVATFFSKIVFVLDRKSHSREARSFSMKLFITSVVTAITVCGCLAVSSSAAQAQIRTSARHRISDKEYQSWVDALDKDKLHPVFVSGYSTGGTPQFAAVATNEGGSIPWAAKHNLTSQGLQDEFTKWTDKGYRLVCIAGYPRDKATRYAGIWLKDGSSAPWEARHDQTASDYQATFNELTKKGLRPVHVTGYMVGKSHRLASIFINDGVTDWMARHDQTSEQYQKLIDEWKAKGYRPACAAAYPTAAGPRFALVVVRDKDTPWAARHNLTAGQYQKEFDKWTGQGYRPLQVCGYPSASEVRYLAVFVKSDGTPAKPLPMSGTEVTELAAYDQAMQKFMQARNIKAGTLAVMRNGKLVLARGYGWLDSGETQQCGPQTPMRLASIAKPITLAAVQKLMRERKLARDTKVFSLLGIKAPSGQTMDKRLSDITVEHLIQHRGGWDREEAGDPMFKSLQIAKALGKEGPATANDVSHYMAGQPLQFDPGSKSVYSNFGYCLLGRVIEKVSGQSYADYVKAEVAAPLGLTSIELGRTLPKNRNSKEPVYRDRGVTTNVMLPSSTVKVPWPDGGFHLEAMDSHGGLIASAPDLVKFLQAYWMNGSPRKAGESTSYIFTGSLPGTYTFMTQRPDGINIAVLFNQRGSGSDPEYDEIQGLLTKTTDGIKAWPK
jgi:CubicO group peptidase (beta-lactamase class C family)